jgi:chromosome segregation protein
MRRHKRPLVDLLRFARCQLCALLTDWLQGCHIAHQLDEAWALRDQLLPGEVIYLASGHAVSAPQRGAFTRKTPSSLVCWRARRRSST